MRADGIQTLCRIVRDYSAQLGRGIAPYDLRRTHSQLAYKAGCPIDQIQLALGRQSIQTTEIYLGTRQNLEQGPGDFIDLS